MVVERLNGSLESVLTQAGNKLVVIDFGATWCGPCKFIKPKFHDMSLQYPNVVFIEVDEAEHRELVQQLGVRGFPTFQYYLNGKKVDEVVGADPNKIIARIEQWQSQGMNSFMGAGVALGSTSGVDPREARLQAMRAPAAPVNVTEDEELAKALALSQQELSEHATSTTNEDASMDTEPVAAEVDAGMLTSLTDMGFPDLRARKAILATNATNLEGCIEWLDAHQDDADIDAPITLLDMSKSTAKKTTTPMTKEEKEAKVAELQKRIAERKVQRKEEEKQHDKVSELQRREMGKNVNAAKEEFDAVQRKRDIATLKKEKDDSKRERERLRMEIAKDKAERIARGGKLTGSSRDPVRLQDLPSSAPVEKKKAALLNLSPTEKIEESIAKLKQYRVGNDGLTALKTLNVYVKNLLGKPDEDKFRTINLTNAAFKKRVGALVGGISFLLALGYVKDEETQVLTLSVEDRKNDLLTVAQTSLTAAISELS